MTLNEAQREYVMRTAVELIRHPQRERLLRSLADRLAAGDYPDEEEQHLDRVVYALAHAVDEQLRER